MRRQTMQPAERRKIGWQDLVDEVFEACLLHDRRTLAEIRAAARSRGALFGLASGGEPTDHELQIMISRNCMGEGEWQYYPAYSSPPRYVSRRRIAALVAQAEAGQLPEEGRKLLRQMLDDLSAGVAHWKAKHARARQKVEELETLCDHIAIRAFRGSAGGGLL